MGGGESRNRTDDTQIFRRFRTFLLLTDFPKKSPYPSGLCKPDSGNLRQLQAASDNLGATEKPRGRVIRRAPEPRIPRVAGNGGRAGTAGTVPWTRKKEQYLY